MTITQDLKKTAEDARKPFFAVIGLNDLFIEQGKAVAERAQARFDAYREDAVEGISTFRGELDKALAEGRERANELQQAWLQADAQQLQASLTEQVRSMVRSYASLAERGEQLFADFTDSIGENPVVKRVADLGQAVVKTVEDAATEAEARVRRTVSAVTEQASSMAEKVADEIDKLAEPSVAAARETVLEQPTRTAVKIAAQVEDAAAKPATARAQQATIDVEVDEAPAAKAPARKTARKAPARKAPARKAPARKAAPRKTTAKVTDIATKAAAKVEPVAKQEAAKTEAAKTEPAKTEAVAKPEAAAKPATAATPAESAQPTPAADGDK